FLEMPSPHGVGISKTERATLGNSETLDSNNSTFEARVIFAKLDAHRYPGDDFLDSIKKKENLSSEDLDRLNQIYAPCVDLKEGRVTPIATTETLSDDELKEARELLRKLNRHPWPNNGQASTLAKYAQAIQDGSMTPALYGAMRSLAIQKGVIG